MLANSNRARGNDVATEARDEASFGELGSAAAGPGLVVYAKAMRPNHAR